MQHLSFRDSNKFKDQLLFQLSYRGLKYERFIIRRDWPVNQKLSIDKNIILDYLLV
tara:strand:+ start:350 stop:517 length:168 start_codon:yes stop_codon:yes gene_type:complete